MRTLNHDNIERSYILYTPANLDVSSSVPVVFVFHGGGGNAENAMRMSGMNEIADQQGFLVVYPNGTSRFEDKLFTWNGGDCCGFAQENQMDDVGFVRAIIGDLQTVTNIDPKRVYASGMSNGGIMSYRLACEAADIFAAITSVSGTLNVSPCNPTENISVMHFHGTDDQHIPYNGGVGSESLVDINFVSVQSTVDFWAAFNGCNSQPQTNSFEDVQHQVWDRCAGSSSVELYTIIGGKHAWPGSEGSGWAGGDEPTQSISASQLIWEFFEAHPKP
ncbi:MAG: dienelactone hydrolase family protein [Chloroflexi bacterium]|nr:dienelactone hydrolase family protein [Chloroflexota bacterium]